MEDSTTALFLLTGLVTACGSQPDQSNSEDQNTEAMLAALSISRHYPESPFARPADLY